jgi:hypothetical protein
MSKKTYNVTTRKADGSIGQKGVLAQDSGTTPVVPAIVAAISAALAAAGSGAEVLGVQLGGTVDIDATAA